jgi:molybdopterin/thiamine biosynthesis adenylyltransferase
LKRPIIGHAASSLGGIGVERAQDLARSGKGKIIQVDKDTIKVEDKEEQ